MARRLRNAFLLGVLVGLVVALVRALGRDARPGPAPLDPPSAALPAVRRAPAPEVAAAAAAVADAPAPASSRPDPQATSPAPHDPLSDAAGHAPAATTQPPSATDPAPPHGDALLAPAVPEGDRSWVRPDDAACPDGYPVKAKESSRIFHVPGGLSYERTRPDRCYPDAASAEADGFRAAKR